MRGHSYYPSTQPLFVSNPLTQPIVLSNTLWVGDVDPDVSNQEFLKPFEEIGPVLRLRRFPSNRYAFVIYEKGTDALVAEMKLQGTKIGAFGIRLEIVKPTKSLWIGNVVGITLEALTATFSQYGPIASSRILPQQQCAFVNFISERDAALARENLEGKKLGTMEITVSFKYDKKTKTTPIYGMGGKRKQAPTKKIELLGGVRKKPMSETVVLRQREAPAPMLVPFTHNPPFGGTYGTAGFLTPQGTIGVPIGLSHPFQLVQPPQVSNFSTSPYLPSPYLPPPEQSHPAPGSPRKGGDKGYRKKSSSGR